MEGARRQGSVGGAFLHFEAFLQVSCCAVLQAAGLGVREGIAEGRGLVQWTAAALNRGGTVKRKGLS
jgi:hypothetical protein